MTDTTTVLRKDTTFSSVHQDTCTEKKQSIIYNAVTRLPSLLNRLFLNVLSWTATTRSDWMKSIDYIDGVFIYKLLHLYLIFILSIVHIWQNGRMLLHVYIYSLSYLEFGNNFLSISHGTNKTTTTKWHRSRLSWK